MAETGAVQQEMKPTAAIFAMLALRQHRLNEVVFRRAGLPLRITRQVELYLTCFRLYKEAELYQAEKQALISQLLQGSQIKAFIDQAALKRAELRAAIEAAPTDNEKRTLLGQLVALTNAAGAATERLQALEEGHRA
jgi:hypothetical protein